MQGVKSLCRHQPDFPVYKELCRCGLAMRSCCQFLQSNPQSWQQPGLFGGCHRKPLHIALLDVIQSQYLKLNLLMRCLFGDLSPHYLVTSCRYPLDMHIFQKDSTISDFHIADQLTLNFSRLSLYFFSLLPLFLPHLVLPFQPPDPFITVLFPFPVEVRPSKPFLYTQVLKQKTTSSFLYF